MCAGAVAPDRVPGAQVLAGERAFDARAPERAGHDAVELAAAAERAPAPVGDPKSVMMPGEHLVAFLPVAAGHVKREPRLSPHAVVPWNVTWVRSVAKWP